MSCRADANAKDKAGGTALTSAKGEVKALLLEKAAAAGNVQAMNSLGALYRGGEGDVQDYSKAREWFQKAADAGNALAMYNLAGRYGRGAAGVLAHEKAREWDRIMATLP